MTDDTDTDIEEEEEEEPYVNEACPAECSMEHSVPRVDQRYGSHFQCPDTDTSYVWCVECGLGWEEDRWEDADTYEVNGRSIWLCGPDNHDITSCSDCGGYFYSDDISYSERRDAYYCSSCYDENENELTPGRSPRYCSTCRQTDRHYDEIREDYLCDHRVKVILAGDPFYPVKLMGVLV